MPCDSSARRPPLDQDVTVRFQVHNLGADVATRNWIAQMRRTYAESARELAMRLPPSREQFLPLTHLEEAMFWTSAAAARTNGVPNGYGEVPTTERQDP